MNNIFLPKLINNPYPLKTGIIYLPEWSVRTSNWNVDFRICNLLFLRTTSLILYPRSGLSLVKYTVDFDNLEITQSNLRINILFQTLVFENIYVRFMNLYAMLLKKSKFLTPLSFIFHNPQNSKLSAENEATFDASLGFRIYWELQIFTQNLSSWWNTRSKIR